MTSPAGWPAGEYFLITAAVGGHHKHGPVVADVKHASADRQLQRGCPSKPTQRSTCLAVAEVERLLLLADAEVLDQPRIALRFMRYRIGGDQLAPGTDAQDAVAMLVHAVEVAARARLDVCRRIPADLIADQEIVRRREVPELLVVQVEGVVEVGVGGGQHAVGVGGRVVDRIDHRAAVFRPAVAAQPQDITRLMTAAQVDQSVAPDGQLRLTAAKGRVLP